MNAIKVSRYVSRYYPTVLSDLILTYMYGDETDTAKDLLIDEFVSEEMNFEDSEYLIKLDLPVLRELLYSVVRTGTNSLLFLGEMENITEKMTEKERMYWEDQLFLSLDDEDFADLLNQYHINVDNYTSYEELIDTFSKNSHINMIRIFERNVSTISDYLYEQGLED